MKSLVIVLGVVIVLCGLALTADAQTVVGPNCTISWTANTEPDLAGYRVYATQNGATKTIDVLKPATSTTCAAVGTQAGGPLSAEVDAVDLVGNRSVKAGPVVVTQDVVAPTQPSGLTVTPNP